MADEHHVKPIAYVWAGAIVIASIGGAVFVTQWTPMKRSSRAPTARTARAPGTDPRFRLPLERPASPPLGAPEAVTAFSTGIDRLLAGDAAGAIDPLNAAVRMSTGAAEQDARWYLAVALERAGRPDDAATTLDALCRTPGHRRDQACAGFQGLSR